MARHQLDFNANARIPRQELSLELLISLPGFPAVIDKVVGDKVASANAFDI